VRPALVLAALLAPTPLYAQERSDPNDLPPVEQKQAAREGIFIPVSIMGGIHAGGAFNAGKNAPDGVGTKPNGAIGGIDLGLEVGALVWDHLYGGLIGGTTLFISPSDTKANVSSFFVATEFGWLTNANGLGGFFGLGVGYRAMIVGDAVGGANKYDGIEGLATVALHIRLGELARIIFPRIDFGIGPNNGADNVHAILTLGFSIWLNDDIHKKKHHSAP
jgi:hypothetical protein